MSAFKDNDPLFDEMDPCCQREYLDREKAQSIRARLARTDRSTEKIKAKKGVFSRIPTCGTCSCTEDYGLLKQIRVQYASSSNIDGGASEDPEQRRRGKEEEEKEEEEDDDDDDFGLNDDAYVSPYEQAMREQFEAAQAELGRRQALGYGAHAEDSVEHATHSIEGHESVVLHMYSPDDVMCAKLDLVLEALATKHTATRFRRLPLISAAALREKYSMTSGPQVACFVGGDLIASFANLEELIPDGDIRSQDLFRHLSSTGVLEEDAFRGIYDMQERLGRVNEGNSEEEEEEYNEEMRFCEVKGCCKPYAHSHVSGGGDGGIFGSKQCGEALDKNYFLKL